MGKGAHERSPLDAKWLELSKSDTRDPEPGTRNPKPETRNPKFETRNSKPETRNSKPETELFSSRAIVVGLGPNELRSYKMRTSRWTLFDM